LVFGSILGVLFEVPGPWQNDGQKVKQKKQIHKNDWMEKSGGEKPKGVPSTRTA